MGDNPQFCSGATVIKKAGGAVSFSGAHSENTNEWIMQAESFINCATRYNWNTNFATMSTDVKKILEDTASSKAAISSINYDMSGYTSREEAGTMMDVLRDSVMTNISILRDKNSQKFLSKPTTGSI